MLSRNQEIPWLLDLERNVSIKKRKVVKISFLKLFLIDFVNIDYNKRQRYAVKRRLDVEFVKKITLEMVIGQQMAEERHHQNH